MSQSVPHDVFGHGIRGPTTAPYDPLGRLLASAGLFSRTLPHEARAAPSTLRRASLVRLRLRHGVCPAPHRSLQDDACAGGRGGGLHVLSALHLAAPISVISRHRWSTLLELSHSTELGFASAASAPTSTLLLATIKLLRTCDLLYLSETTQHTKRTVKDPSRSAQVNHRGTSQKSARLSHVLSTLCVHWLCCSRHEHHQACVSPVWAARHQLHASGARPTRFLATPKAKSKIHWDLRELL